MRVRTTTSLIGAMLLAAGLVLFGTGPAYAAAPTNDTFGGAIPVGLLPFTATVDTSEATTDADDASVSAGCAPATDASVWYSIRDEFENVYVVDVSESSYPAGIIVVTGAPGAFEVVTCGQREVAFTTTPGTTYYVLAFDPQEDGGGNGGTLVLNVGGAPLPPFIDLTVDRSATFDPATGAATVRGTVNCNHVDEASIEVELRQQIGRFGVVGHGQVAPQCDGTEHSWTAEIYSFDGGGFAGGKAESVTFALACGRFECDSDYVQRTVQLSRR
jgi:hypothetical protein